MPAHDSLALAVAVLIAMPAPGSCLGVGMASMRLIDGRARQPEAKTELQTRFFLAVGVADGAFVIGIGIALRLATARPFA